MPQRPHRSRPCARALVQDFMVAAWARAAHTPKAHVASGAIVVDQLRWAWCEMMMVWVWRIGSGMAGSVVAVAALFLILFVGVTLPDTCLRRSQAVGDRLGLGTSSWHITQEDPCGRVDCDLLAGRLGRLVPSMVAQPQYPALQPRSFSRTTHGMTLSPHGLRHRQS